MRWGAENSAARCRREGYLLLVVIDQVDIADRICLIVLFGKANAYFPLP
jgi:hypothetical protein